jgi:hypothetical protein
MGPGGLAGDPTIRSLRRDIDRHYAATMESGEHVSNGLVGVIFGCLPPDMFNCIFLPADGARGPHLAITFKPAFRGYVTFAAEYWAGLAHGHVPSHQESVGSESSIP